MKQARFLGIGALLALLGCAVATTGPNAGFIRDNAGPEGLGTVLGLVTRVDADPALQAFLSQCPTEVITSLPTSGSNTDCGLNPTSCYAECKAGDAAACFAAARSIERSDFKPRSDFTYPLFMAACKLGDANACTNAAATARNGTWITSAPAVATSPACQLETYQTACEAGSFWGCSMEGTEYRSRGEVALAKEAKAKSCKLAGKNQQWACND
ncbi:hypothetical protein IV417_05125 [Alphaproteobacteria bacterium KMM 3653]|uniref:Lipoprotein n=1 Tax=Harenicola maris TaxID=2841044 RepID=A0AAP2G7D8_9RHOB|nr:hypothetical protein [Harenicola maris]